MKKTQLSARSGDQQAVLHLKQSLKEGQHWYPAMLDAMSLWSSGEEVHQERRYRYLVGGEAFDLLLLAERLYQEVKASVPEDEVERLLFRAEPPLDLSREEFRRRLGAAKHRAHLNFFYGVVVEEALLLAVQSEVRKEQFSGGFFSEDEVIEQACHRAYGESLEELLRQFRKQRKQRWKNSIVLEEQQEFTYWLFKGRLKRAESARMASDTRKALSWLHRSWGDRKSVFR